MKQCMICGFTVDDDVSVCPECGADLAQDRKKSFATVLNLKTDMEIDTLNHDYQAGSSPEPTYYFDNTDTLPNYLKPNALVEPEKKKKSFNWGALIAIVVVVALVAGACTYFLM